VSWNTKQKLGAALAAVAVAGAGAVSALYVEHHLIEPALDDSALVLVVPPGGSSSPLPPDIIDRHESAHGPDGDSIPLDELMKGLMPPSDPSCKPAAEVAEKYKQEGYKGLASGYSTDGAFFILTDQANKKWALVTPDDFNPANACVKHEGGSFETAAPTGRLLYASYPTNQQSATMQLASFIPASNDEDQIPIGPGGIGDTKKLMDWFNSKFAASTVFKGDEGKGKVLRILAGKEHDGAIWTILSSTPDGKSTVENIGENFQFAQNFKPSPKPLQ